MAVTTQSHVNKLRVWENLLSKMGHSSLGNLVSRIQVQDGVTDGGADISLTNTKTGDIIYDVDNDDYYLVTSAGSSKVALNA